MAQCNDCKFWKEQSERTLPHSGICRRNIPTVVPNESAPGRYPVCLEDWWCGEYQVSV